MSQITPNTYTQIMQKLFESEAQDRAVVMQKSLSPLKRCDNQDILKNIINPVTGQPYEDGMILEGEFASMDVLNNNNRYYKEENYLQFVEILKHQIHSPKGVYGELEHPESYAVNMNNVSHKILDIWFDKQQKKVMGIILLLNTEKGKIAQEIIRSGGQIAVSGRGGGDAMKNPDGTITALLKLLVTFDIVYHPGFTSSVMDYTNLTKLSESQRAFIESQTVCLFENQLCKLDGLHKKYLNSHTNLNECNSFYGWLNQEGMQQLFESEQSKDQQQKQEDILQKNEPSNQDELQDSLQDAVDDELSEESNLLQQTIFRAQMVNGQNMMRQRISSRKTPKGGAYYDNAAGFVDNEDSDLYSDGTHNSTNDI